MGRARTLAQVYRHFGEVDAAGTSPLYTRVAVALSESAEALRAIEAAPARKRHPTVILAALHDLALAGRAPALAAAYAAADGDAAAGAAIDTLLRMTDAVVALAVRRRTRTFEDGRGAVLYPAIAEAARRVGAHAVGLIDVGLSAGLDLQVDRVGIRYSNGQSLGDPSSAVQLSSSVVGDRPIPTRALPEVVARIGVECDPAEAIARVPADALPVVTTTWALSRLPRERACSWLKLFHASPPALSSSRTVPHWRSDRYGPQAFQGTAPVRASSSRACSGVVATLGTLRGVARAPSPDAG